MRGGMQSRTNLEKIAIFRRRFAGLTHVYGTYDPQPPQTGGVRDRQVKRQVTDAVILAHLRGRQPYGVYLLVGDRTGAIAADFDRDDPLPPIECVRQAGHYDLGAYIERSKQKGYHVWMFMDDRGAPAAKVRAVMRLIVTEIGQPDTELFPKQDRLGAGAQYGNFINAPLFGRLVPEGRTVFVDPGDNMRPYANQWDLLDGARLIAEQKLDDIIEVNGLSPPAADGTGGPSSERTDPVQGYRLPPCAARMLAEGVRANQRIACFRLAVDFKRFGFPQDIAVGALKAWAVKNKPDDGKRIITEVEIIAQTKCAYGKDYRSCGCEESAIQEFCDPTCPVRKGRAEGETPSG